jgi:hypothetical protein
MGDRHVTRALVTSAFVVWTLVVAWNVLADWIAHGLFDDGVPNGMVWIFLGGAVWLVLMIWTSVLAALGLAALAGLRSGEIRALRWTDIDLDRSTISVSRRAHSRTGRSKSPRPRAGRGQFRSSLRSNGRAALRESGRAYERPGSDAFSVGKIGSILPSARRKR